MFKAVIWDLDGTLLYTLEDLQDASNHALIKNGYQPINREQTRQRIGNGIGRLFALSVPAGADNEKLPQIRRDFSEYYLPHCMDKTVPYEGIVELVRQLKESGVKNAIVTNKIHSAVGRISEHYFGNMMDVGLGERENVKRKPDPQSVLEALQLLNVRPEDAVYVGDSEVDVATARNAGVTSVAVSWGYRDREVLEACQPDFIADNAEELRRFLLCR
ncbi:MAG: HAD family hydrolase [Erysipelotrichaceae bacterium]|nr:HAD family hydrolase [Erysipelotrichaceae bacterium]